MQILILTHLAIYPADAGAKIKTLQLFRYLVRRHSVLYCTFTRSKTEQEQLQQLPIPRQHIITVPLQRSRLKDSYFLIKSLVCNDTFLLQRDDNATMKAQVELLLYEKEIDILHVDQLNMIRFVPANWPGRVVLDEHNAVWLVLQRLRQGTHNPLVSWFLRREVRHIRRIEGEACNRAQIVLAVSEQDRSALQEVAGPEANIVVVPITIDRTRFVPVRQARSPIPGRLLSIGTLFWPPNSEGIAWWLRTGYAYLQASYPAVTYDIVGARPSRHLQALAKKHPTVHLHGYVKDTSSFWSQTTALVVPLLAGGGVRVKILEAMAMGVPVIATSIGCEGLNVKHGIHILIADTPMAFAHACLAVFQDPQLAQTLTKNAYQLLCEQYDAQTALAPLQNIYY